MKRLALYLLTFGLFAIAWGAFSAPILVPIGSEIISLLISGAIYSVVLDGLALVALLIFAFLGHIFFTEKNAVHFMFGMTALSIYPLGVLLLHWLGSLFFFPQFTGWLLWVIPALYVILSTSLGVRKEV